VVVWGLTRDGAVVAGERTMIRHAVTPPRVAPRALVLTARLIGPVLLAALLWFALGALLATDRGLDLTDEGLYLLDSDPPAPGATWATPYGWITAPLFRSVNQSIADARTAAAVILALSGLLLARLAVSMASELMPNGRPQTRHDRVGNFLLTAALGASGLMYVTYIGFLRTPSYNWVNLVGIILTLSGVLRACRPPGNSSLPQSSSLHLGLSATLIAAGSFVALHAKPTTPLVLAGAAFPLLGRRLGSKGRIRLLFLTSILGSVFVVAASITPFWPDEFLAVLGRVVALPPVTPNQGLTRAIALLAIAPIEIFRRALISQPHWLVGPSLAAVVLHQISRRPVIHRKWLQVVGVLLMVPAAAFVLMPDMVVTFVHAGALGPLSDVVMPGRLNWPPDGYLTRSRPLLRIVGWLLAACSIAALRPRIDDFALKVSVIALLSLLGAHALGLLPLLRVPRAGLIVGALDLAMAWFVWERWFPRRIDNTENLIPAKQSHALSERTFVLLFILSGVGAYALGHDTGPVNAMPGAAAVVLVALAFLVRSSANYHPGAALILSLTIIGATSVGITQARSAPYRGAPIAEQTVQVEVGRHGSLLRLDPPLADYLTEFRQAAEAAGWVPGQQMYGLHVTWSSTLPFFLGAEVPPSIMPTLPGAPGGIDRLAFDLDRQDLAGWSQAWLLLPDFSLAAEDGIESHELEAVRLAIRLFTAKVGTEWPADYELVWTAPRDAPVSPHSRVTLWSPRSAGG
jgi:hypothetical protein